MDISALHERAGYLLRLLAGFDRQTVVGKLDTINAMEAAPEEILMPAVLDVEPIDGVSYTYLLTGKHAAMVCERAFRPGSRSYPNAAGPLASPFRFGIIEHILAVDIVDVGCPKIALRVPLRACLVGKGGAYKRPVDKVFRLVDRRVSDVLRGIEVPATVLGPDHGRIGQAGVNERIPVRLRFRDACYRARGTSCGRTSDGSISSTT